MTAKELQDFKVDAYDKINWDAQRLQGTPIKQDTLKTMARGSKDAIERAVPETQALNKALGELYELRTPLGKAGKRLENRNLISINTPLNIGGAALVGDLFGSAGIGTTVGMITAVLSNPKAKARIAIALNKIQQGNPSWLEKNLSRAELNVALALAGREAELSQETNQ
jgi:hypothetical protein